MFNVKQWIILILQPGLRLAEGVIMQKSPREIAELVESTMREFNSAMERREALIIQASEQTAQIIRFSMISLIIWAAAMFALIVVLLSDMGNITRRLDDVAGYMQNISQNITVVAENVHEVKLSLDNLNEHVKVMPVMNDSVAKMSEDIFNINNSINQINASVLTLNDNLGLMRVDMTKLNHQVGGLNTQLGIMGSNVNRMSAPMKFFPFP
jgi:uncharacterized protein YoxC